MDITQEEVGPANALEIDPGPSGTVIYPGHPGWDVARRAWVANVDQQPTAVAIVRTVKDVSAVVGSASRIGLKVVAQGTGHGAMSIESLAGAVLVRTSALDQIAVDPIRCTARCGAGAEWAAVAAAAAEYGLAAQAGSSGDVGIAGYLLSGGISWLARQYGLAVNDVVRFEVVTADGEVRQVDSEHDSDLFWALRGGGGSFGIVTGIELRLHPLRSVIAGTLFFPMQQAREVLHAWRGCLERLSDRTMSCGRLLQFPELPLLPAALRGQAFAAVEIAHLGEAAELKAAFAPLRHLRPTVDTISEIPAVGLAALHMDPPGPVPCRGNGMLLNELPPLAIDALVTCAGPGSGSPLSSVEVRHLGGAVAQRPEHAGALGHLEAEFLMYAVGFTPDLASTAKVNAHIDRVAEALRPWSADLNYANLDEKPAGGRARFHDQMSLERLRAIKHRIDPDGRFTCGHPVSAESWTPMQGHAEEIVTGET